MITLQDRYIGITKLTNVLSFVNEDKTTKVCAADIAQFIDEWYPGLFESIASDDRAYATFNFHLDTMCYYSYQEIAINALADFNSFNDIKLETVLALDFGYDSLEEMENYYIVISDTAIDGFLIFE